jgi:hypothetical protein
VWFYKEQISPTDNILEIYFAGCSEKCPECFNENLWEKSAGKEKSPGEILEILKDYKDIASQVHILGGEPSEQPADEMTIFLANLSLMFPNIPRVFFTGKDFLDPPPFCTHLKTGAFDKNLPESEKTELGWKLASNNQKLKRITE